MPRLLPAEHEAGSQITFCTSCILPGYLSKYNLTKLLFQVLDKSSCAHLVLLDGLDELAEPHGGINVLFQLLVRLVAADRVKLCVSSRPERLFAVQFASNPSIHMQDLTYWDICDYTTDFLKDLQLYRGDHLYREIHREISQKAEGVFIWVYLVLRSVKNGIEQYAESWNGIYDLIVMLPPDLMRLYEDMWSRLGGKNEKHIKKQRGTSSTLGILTAQL